MQAIGYKSFPDTSISIDSINRSSRWCKYGVNYVTSEFEHIATHCLCRNFRFFFIFACHLFFPWKSVELKINFAWPGLHVCGQWYKFIFLLKLIYNQLMVHNGSWLPKGQGQSVFIVLVKGIWCKNMMEICKRINKILNYQVEHVCQPVQVSLTIQEGWGNYFVFVFVFNSFYIIY